MHDTRGPRNASKAILGCPYSKEQDNFPHKPNKNPAIGTLKTTRLLSPILTTSLTALVVEGGLQPEELWFSLAQPSGPEGLHTQEIQWKAGWDLG